MTFEDVLLLPSHVIGRCLDCGLMVNLSFPQRTPTAVFDASYHGDAQSLAFADAGFGIEDPSRGIWEHGLRVAETLTAGRRLLDVGAARGSFVALARSRGWDAQGVELSADAAESAQTDHGLPVAPGTIDVMPSDPVFDAITIWDVLEHVTDVAATLRAAKTRLAPNGVVILTTDNFDSLIADLARSAYALTGRRVAFPAARFFIPYNTVYFTPESLRGVLRQQDLHTVYSQGIDYPEVKMNLSLPERVVTRVLYAAGRKSGRESQMLLAAKQIDSPTHV